MDNFLDLGNGNYSFLDDITNVDTKDQVVYVLWRLYFDGSSSKNGSGCWNF